VFAAGAALVALSFVTLGSALTPLPRPKESGALVRHGVYARARHPIYGGVLLISLGWSVAFAPWGIAPTIALALLFALKAHREEEWLAERYPDYAEYRRRTPKRFLPFVV
jgi:protein-S-isoprenylcysteine O-methyltransferase Ste14